MPIDLMGGYPAMAYSQPVQQPAASGGAFASAAAQGGMAPQAATPAADAVFGAGGADGAAKIAEERATANVMNDRFAQQCQTCKNRRYIDGSDDSGVSFQTPQHIAPELSASAVSSHEQEHVVREQAKADREGGEVVSQSVVLHGDICPECGRYYIAGGTTTTTTRSGGESSGSGHGEDTSGRLLDATA